MHVAIEGPDGWSDWIEPAKKDYRLACCDCGLVHDFEIRIVAVRSRKGANLRFTKAKMKGLTIVFRARRNDRSTAQKRRNKKHAKFLRK